MIIILIETVWGVLKFSTPHEDKYHLSSSHLDVEIPIVGKTEDLLSYTQQHYDLYLPGEQIDVDKDSIFANNGFQVDDNYNIASDLAYQHHPQHDKNFRTMEPNMYTYDNIDKLSASYKNHLMSRRDNRRSESGSQEHYNYIDTTNPTYYGDYLSNKTTMNGSEKDGPVALHGTYDKYGQYIGEDKLFSKFNTVNTHGLNKILSTDLESGKSMREGFKTQRFETPNIPIKEFDSKTGKAKVGLLLGNNGDNNDSDYEAEYDEYGRNHYKFKYSKKNKNMLGKNCEHPGNGFGHIHCDKTPPSDAIGLTRWKGPFRYIEPYRRKEKSLPNKKSHLPYQKRRIFVDTDFGYSEGDRLHIMKLNSLNGSKCGSKHHYPGVGRFKTPGDYYQKYK